MTQRVRIVGGGRAGQSIARALQTVGWDVVGILGRSDDPRRAAHGVDVVIIATPDSEIAAVSTAIDPGDAVLVHLSGATGLDPLQPHRAASVHPLMSLPDPETGAAALLSGGDFAVAGDPAATAIVAALGGRAFSVAEQDRVLYHATAAVAANHVVALMGQVERLAQQCNVPVEAFYRMAADTLANAAELGPANAITGPAARGDHETLARHVAALPERERSLYRALADAAADLAAAS